jgi:NAD(P) transhydrogenase
MHVVLVQIIRDMDPKSAYMRTAVLATLGSGSLVALGMAAPGPAFNTMLTTFALSGMLGYHTGTSG